MHLYPHIRTSLNESAKIKGMKRTKIVAFTLLAIAVSIIILSGCNDATFGSAYSSGPPNNGEGTNMKNGTKVPQPSYGTVAGAGYTGNVTSGGATGNEYGRG